MAMTTILPELVFQIKICLKIICLNPASDFGQDWGFANGVYGWGDGITGFPDALAKADSLIPETGRQFLFADGLDYGQETILGSERRGRLSSLALADPDLGWSLFKEKDQKILRHFHDVYGVESLEFLRRVFVHGGQVVSLVLQREQSGSWSWLHSALDSKRDAKMPALVFRKDWKALY